MTYTVLPQAEKQLKKLPKIHQISVIKKLKVLDSGVQSKKLSGYKKTYRTRVGNYRIIYKKTSKEIFIILIGHRKDIYKLLERLI